MTETWLVFSEDDGGLYPEGTYANLDDLLEECLPKLDDYSDSLTIYRTENGQSQTYYLQRRRDRLKGISGYQIRTALYQGQEVIQEWIEPAVLYYHVPVPPGYVERENPSGNYMEMIVPFNYRATGLVGLSGKSGDSL